MLMLATNTATRASSITARLSLPTCRMPPTRMIPEMALVYAISGVCSACETLPMT